MALGKSVNKENSAFLQTLFVTAYHGVWASRLHLSGARAGDWSLLSGAQLREVAWRLAVSSLEHRARAPFDEEHLRACLWARAGDRCRWPSSQASTGTNGDSKSTKDRGVALATPRHHLMGSPFIRWAWPSYADGRYGHRGAHWAGLSERCAWSCVTIWLISVSTCVWAVFRVLVWPESAHVLVGL